MARNPSPLETAPPRQGPALPLPPEPCRLPRRPRTARLPTAGFAALVFFPTQRSLVHRSVGRQPLPVDPDQPVIAQQPLPPELVEHPGLFGEAPVGLRTDPGGVQCAPLAAGAQDEEDRAARSGTRGLWQPSGWRGRGGSNGT